MTNSYDNIMTYLKWRGDVSVKDCGFNEVDALILSELVYLNFDGIVPGVGKKSSVKIGNVVKNSYEGQEQHMFSSHEKMLQELAKCPRFSNMILSNYESRFDTEVQQQFAAMHIQIDRNKTFIAFRGTDSSVVGWKEDFNMSYMMPVPAQQSAVEYLNKTAKGFWKKYYIGGHSKGGNLAVYSSVFCNEKVQKKIEQIYSFDGPGFTKKVVKDPAYKRVSNRICAFVPAMSVVGMLMEHEEELRIVESNAKAIMQHDAFTWGVERDHLKEADKLHDVSVSVSRTVKSWLADISPEDRQALVESFFGVFESVGIQDFTELIRPDIKTTAALIKATAKVPHKHRTMVLRLVKLMVEDLGSV